ncbi:MAG: hypothetical protein FJX74_01410 [Armatimonadetes bacterium]|nr:hypothetical protein [Armatimonadota bacterium]
MRPIALRAVILTLSLIPALLPAQTVNVPIGGGTAGIDDLKLVQLSGIEAKVGRVADADAGKPALKVAFTKADEPRRLLALEGVPAKSAEGCKALVARYRLSLKTGEARLALVAWDASGNAWYKTGSQPAPDGEFTDGRVAVGAPRAAAFNQEPALEFTWGDIERVWVGLVIDGAAEGTLELSAARLTDEPYRATEPLVLKIADAKAWGIGQDPAVTSEMTVADEGPDGEPCTKLAFTLPGGKHMYLVPSMNLPQTDLEGYSALEITYRAQLPPGIQGLLLMLGESGGQFMVEPLPPPSEDWVTMTIPFADFKLGGWSKDDNGQLDTDRVQNVMVGTHGVSTTGGQGLIEVSDVRFVP